MRCYRFLPPILIPPTLRCSTRMDDDDESERALDKHTSHGEDGGGEEDDYDETFFEDQKKKMKKKQRKDILKNLTHCEGGRAGCGCGCGVTGRYSSSVVAAPIPISNGGDGSSFGGGLSSSSFHGRAVGGRGIGSSPVHSPIASPIQPNNSRRRLSRRMSPLEALYNIVDPELSSSSLHNNSNNNNIRSGDGGNVHDEENRRANTRVSIRC